MVQKVYGQGKKSHAVPVVQKDFSNRVVFAMLVMVIVVSVFSLGFYLHTLETSKQKLLAPLTVNTQNAQVSVMIDRPASDEDKNPPVLTGAQVGLFIDKNRGVN